MPNGSSGKFATRSTFGIRTFGLRISVDGQPILPISLTVYPTPNEPWLVDRWLLSIASLSEGSSPTCLSNSTHLVRPDMVLIAVRGSLNHRVPKITVVLIIIDR